MLSDLWEICSHYISVPYVLVVIFLANGTKPLLGGFIKDRFPRLARPNVYAVFIVASAAAAVFHWVFNEDALKLLVSYGFATSMYDVIIEAAIRMIKQLTTKDGNEQPTQEG